jgi:hypothetical protein
VHGVVGQRQLAVVRAGGLDGQVDLTLACVLREDHSRAAEPFVSQGRGARKCIARGILDRVQGRAIAREWCRYARSYASCCGGPSRARDNNLSADRNTFLILCRRHKPRAIMIERTQRDVEDTVLHIPHRTIRRASDPVAKQPDIAINGWTTRTQFVQNERIQSGSGPERQCAVRLRGAEQIKVSSTLPCRS